MRKREREIKPFLGSISSTVSALILFLITCHKLKYFFFSIHNKFVGCNLIFKGANWLISFTYLVVFYHLVTVTYLVPLNCLVPLINSIIHSTLVLECTDWLLCCANNALSSCGLAALARLWRESVIVGLLSWSLAFESETPCICKAGQRLRRFSSSVKYVIIYSLSFIVK